MTFLFIASIIICPMWMATCPCEADSVVGKLKTTVGKVSVRSEGSNTGTSGLFANMFSLFLVVRLWGPNYPIHVSTKPWLGGTSDTVCL